MNTGKLESSSELDAAEEFINLYYEKLDKQQYQLIARLYLPDAMLIWNGISNLGPDKIQQFISGLSQSNHNVLSFDMQRIYDSSTDKKNFLIKTGGLVRFKDHNMKQFFQTFFTTFDGDKYRISIDNYRIIDGTP